MQLTSLPSGGVQILLVASYYRGLPEISASLLGYEARMETFTTQMTTPSLFFLGLAALLDRQILVPAVPEVHLVDEANQIDNLIIEPGDSLSKRVTHYYYLLFGL